MISRMLCQLMEQLRPQIWNTLELVLFISILLISRLPDVSNILYHGIGENQLFEGHI